MANSFAELGLSLCDEIKVLPRLLNTLKDVRGWHVLTMKAAVTLCIVWLPPEEPIS